MGAKQGSCRFDRLAEKNADKKQAEKEEEEKREKEESDKLTSATQTLCILSVLIATVTFGATFALPGGYKADDHVNGGTPTMAGPGRWYFDAFMIANTLAFICSLLATVGLMYSAISMLPLRHRYMHLGVSVHFGGCSITSLIAAFALGVYMVLAPVARSTAIAICAMSPTVLLYRYVQYLRWLHRVLGPIVARRGVRYAVMYAAKGLFCKTLSELWPLVVIFSWAGHLRNQRGTITGR